MDENEKRLRREKKSSDLAMKIFPLLIRKSDSQDQISRRSKTSHLFTHIKKITERNFTLSLLQYERQEKLRTLLATSAAKSLCEKNSSSCIPSMISIAEATSCQLVCMA